MTEDGVTIVATVSNLPVSGGHLRVEEGGEGPPVVLGTEAPSTAACGPPGWGARNGRYRAVAFHVRSHGHSSAPTAPFRQYDDVAALVRHPDQRRAVLVGLAMGRGAWVAAILRLAHNPHRTLQDFHRP